MKLKKLSLMLVALVFAVVGFTACDDGDSVGIDTSEVTLLLTDAPGDVEEAVVTISQIYLQGEEEGDVESSGRVILMDEPVTVNLLELVNETMELVSDLEIPAGSYGQMRFVVDGAYIAVEGESEGELEYYATSGYDQVPGGIAVDGTLNCPSCSQSGLKVLLHGVSIDSNQEIILLDFDVSESFGRDAGGSGQWVMHPVIKATEIEFTGSLALNVEFADTVEIPSPADTTYTEEDFQVMITYGDTGEATRFLTLDGEAYSASFLYLIPENSPLTVSLVAPEGVSVTTDPGLPFDVTILSGQDVVREIVVTSASLD